MDISNVEIEVNCPNCNFINNVTLFDASNETTIICIGCLVDIALQDLDGNAKKIINDIGSLLRS